MITNDGVELISKYLAGEASSYASYIAIGCGPRPLSSINSVTVGDAMTISGVSGTGPYTATVTTSADNLNYIQVGDILTSITIPPGVGSLGSGIVTVTAITGKKTFTVSSTSSITSGVVAAVFAKSSSTSTELSSKTKLDFEVARFPITSRSYVVDKQVAKCTDMYISNTNEVTVVTASAHPFGVGDIVFITDVDIYSTGPATYTQVNGMYVISSTSSSGFVAQLYDTTYGGWGSSLFGSLPSTNVYAGYTFNSDEFNATVYTKQVSLTAEVSDVSQYDITELGLYSLGSNQYSTALDSRTLLNFTQTESWQYFDYASSSFIDVPVVDSITTSFPTGTFSTSPFFVSSNDAYWTADAYRTLRQEKPRILSDAIILPGGLSDYSSANTFASTSDYLRLSNPGIDLSRNSTQDEISIAFSVVNATATPTASPTAYYIMLEFMSSNGTDSAKLTFSETTLPINPNRYTILTKKISDIVYTSSNFNWNDVVSLKIYSAIEVAGTPTDHFAIVLDGLRLENTTTENPLYALTAYTIVDSDSAAKIIKGANSKDLINFRLDLAIGN
jgi:hypothetical protein